MGATDVNPQRLLPTAAVRRISVRLTNPFGPRTSRLGRAPCGLRGGFDHEWQISRGRCPEAERRSQDACVIGHGLRPAGALRERRRLNLRSLRQPCDQRIDRFLVWSKYRNCRRDKKLYHCRVVSSPIVRYHFVGIEGAHCGSMGGGGELMKWARILAPYRLLYGVHLAADEHDVRDFDCCPAFARCCRLKVTGTNF
jgi:hypothetical protein